MKELLTYIISSISGTDEFEITEEMDEDAQMYSYNVAIDPNYIGLIIGKDGKTIKNIRRIASIRAVLEDKSIQINITEK